MKLEGVWFYHRVPEGVPFYHSSVVEKLLAVGLHNGEIQPLHSEEGNGSHGMAFR